MRHKSYSHCSVQLGLDYPDQYAQLMKDYPKLYKLASDSNFKYNIRIPLAWLPLVYELSMKLEAMIANMPEEIQSDFYAMQVKEKFGGLRFYMNRQTKEMNDAIKTAQGRSRFVCEFCGSPATLVYPPMQEKVTRQVLAWHQTVCVEHYNARLIQDGWDRNSVKRAKRLFEKYFWLTP